MNVTEQLRMVQLIMEDKRQKCLERVEKLKQLQLSLDKEKLKIKSFWCLKYDQQLAHKEALKKKDNEIAQLTILLTIRLLVIRKPICPW